MGNVNSKKAREVLNTSLKKNFANNSDWKWIPGRDLVGATLGSLSQVGDRESAFLVLHYIRNPGCDFLYEDLKKCLVSIGQPIVHEIIAAVKEDINKKPNDWGTRVLFEALCEVRDPLAIPFFIETLQQSFSDQYTERDFKSLAISGLGKLKVHEALGMVARELKSGNDPSIRYVAATALGQIGGGKAYAALEEKLMQLDEEYIERECLNSLHLIAFEGIKTDKCKLRTTQLFLRKSGPEEAFQIMYQAALEGEAWTTPFLFEILPKIPLSQNFHYCVELLNTKDRIVFNGALSFLNKITRLGLKLKFSDPAVKKQKAIQKIWEWYNGHYEGLRWCLKEK